MKAYLAITGALFALLAIAHVLRTIAERDQLAKDPWFWLQGPGLGLLGAALAFWAFRLFRNVNR